MEKIERKTESKTSKETASQGDCKVPKISDFMLNLFWRERERLRDGGRGSGWGWGGGGEGAEEGGGSSFCFHVRTCLALY